MTGAVPLSDQDIALLARAIREKPPRNLRAILDVAAGWADEVSGGRGWAAWLAVAAGGEADRPLPSPFRREGEDAGRLLEWAMGIRHLREAGSRCTVEVHGENPHTVIRAAWKPPKGEHTISVWLTFPGATRSEQQEVLATVLGRTFEVAAQTARYQLEQARSLTTDVERYSREKFELNLELVAGHLAEYLLLAPATFAEALELLAVQLDAYLGETFGEGAGEALLGDLRLLAEDTARPPSPGAARALNTYARLLHLRTVLLTPARRDRLPKGLGDLLPPALGHLLPKRAQPWLDALAELLLVHWVGSAGALRLALQSSQFGKKLKGLGWPVEGAAVPLASIHPFLAEAAHRRYGDPPPAEGEARAESAPTSGGGGGNTTDEWVFWEPPPGTSDALTLRQRLEWALTRWLMLHRLLDLELVPITRTTFRTDGPLVRILDRLWPETRELAFLWLIAHKQWSTPRGVDCEEGERRRAALFEQLENSRRKENPLDSVARLDATGGFTLHVDPLWSNLYLVQRLLRHLGPGVPPEDAGEPSRRWEALRREVPTPAAQRHLLRHLSRALVFLLWQLLQHERYPKRYAIVPPEKARAAIEGERMPLAAQEPVGAERYADSLIYLMDVFGHAVLHVEREVDIARYLRRVIESELLLHAVSDYYRDHLYHLVDLAMLGDLLLTARGGRRSGYLWKLLAPGGGGPTGRYRLDVLRRQWFIAAVFHDVGYLFSLVARIPELLREQGSRTHERFVRAIGEAFRGEIEALEDTIGELTRHLAERRVGLDRGVHSAVILRDHLLEAVRPAERSGMLLAAYAPSLRAICQHSLHREKVSQDEDPLSYLMVLCDELTDWGRTRVRARELRRFTIFQPKLVANWQERRIPVLTELLVRLAGVEGGAFVLDTPGGGIGRGAQPYTHRRVHRLEMVQIYHQDEVGYLNPVYLWVLRARNLERLLPSQRSDRGLAITIFTLTGVPYRLRKAETLHSAVLEEIAVRHPELRLGDLTRTLEHSFNEALELGRAADGGGQDPVGQTVERLAKEIHQQDGAGSSQPPRRGARTVELQVFSIDRLSDDQPLRGFDRERDLEALARATQQVVAEREEQRRLRGLRALRSGEFRRAGGSREEEK